MKSLHRLFWSALAAAAFHGASSAQVVSQTVDTTGATTTTTGSTGLGSTSSGLANSNTGNSQFGANGSGTAVTITAPSSYATTSVLATSNILGPYYANPYYQGRAGTAGSQIVAITNPGGFGAALYGTGGSGGTGTTGRTSTTGTTGFGNTGTAGRTASTGTTGFGSTSTGFGSTTGTGGRTTGGLGGTTLGGNNTLGGQNGSSNMQNNGMTAPVAISYTATYRFPIAVTTVPQMQSELRGIIDASSMISNPKNIAINTQSGGIVVLTGTVADEDEARTVEGMIRLTPGIRDVKNELRFPVLVPPPADPLVPAAP